MEVPLGRFRARYERPEPLKFAWPIVVLPELFTTTRHLAVLIGYLATIGWEVYAPDIHPQSGAGRRQGRRRSGFAGLVGLVDEVLVALGREAIVLGHGIGGLLALKLAEKKKVRAAVALAPLVPGFSTPLVAGLRSRISRFLGGPIRPPRGRTLFDFLAGIEPYQRTPAIAALIPDVSAAAFEVLRGEMTFPRGDPAVPRLIVAGDSDRFSPFDHVSTFADTIGARLVRLRGEGHWLIGGRALERAIGETQRFLVRALGQELLLLYPQEWAEDDGGGTSE